MISQSLFETFSISDEIKIGIGRGYTLFLQLGLFACTQLLISSKAFKNPIFDILFQIFKYIFSFETRFKNFYLIKKII